MNFTEIKNAIGVGTVTFRPFVAEDNTITEWYRDWREPDAEGEKPKSILVHKDVYDKMLAARNEGKLNEITNFGYKVEEKPGKKHAKYDNYVIFMFDEAQGETF